MSQCLIVLFSCITFALHYVVRPWKYDSSILEFFVQTADKVSVRRSDLEKVMRASEATPEAGNIEHNVQKTIT